MREETPLHPWVLWTELSGSVSGLDASNRDQYAVAIYTFAWDIGKEIGYWYVQPYAEDCLTRIGIDNTWRAKVRIGSDYGVLLASLGTTDPSEVSGRTTESRSANGCGFPQKLYTFPPQQSGIIVWVYKRAARFTLMFWIGLCCLAAAFLLTRGRVRHLQSSKLA